MSNSHESNQDTSSGSDTVEEGSASLGSYLRELVDERSETDDLQPIQELKDELDTAINSIKTDDTLINAEDEDGPKSTETNKRKRKEDPTTTAYKWGVVLALTGAYMVPERLVEALGRFGDVVGKIRTDKTPWRANLINNKRARRKLAKGRQEEDDRVVWPRDGMRDTWERKGECFD